MDPQSPARVTPEKSNTRILLPEGVTETIVTAHQLRMNPVRQLGIGGVSVPPPQTCRKIFDKRYYIQQINNHIIIIDKEVNRLYDQLMHHKLQATNYEFVERKVTELKKQFEEKEEYLKILNDVVRLHYLHKGKPIDVSKNITMLRKANKERMDDMERIQFFDRKDLERVVDKLRSEIEQEKNLKEDMINSLSFEDKEELEELTFVKDELGYDKENMDIDFNTLKSDISRFEAKISKDQKLETKYKLRSLISEAPQIAEKYKMENQELQAFEKQGNLIRMEIEALGMLVERLEIDMNTDCSDQNRRLAKFREFQRRERIIENFLQNYSKLARETFEKLSDMQNRIVYGLEYLSATDEEKDPLWDPEEYEYYVNPNLQKDAVIQIIVKLQKQYLWFRHTLNQFRIEINELHKLKRKYLDEIDIFTNYEDVRDEMIDRQNELATLKTSLTRSLESTSAAIVEATDSKQSLDKKIQNDAAYNLYQELQSKLTKMEEKNQKLKDTIDNVVFGNEVEPIRKECLDDMGEIKTNLLVETEENLSFIEIIDRKISAAKVAEDANKPYMISQIRFFKCGALDPNTCKVPSELSKKTSPPSSKTTPADNKSVTKETISIPDKSHYYSDEDSSPDSSRIVTSQVTVDTNIPASDQHLSSARKNLRHDFNTGVPKEQVSSVKKDSGLLPPESAKLMSPSKLKDELTTSEGSSSFGIQQLYKSSLSNIQAQEATTFIFNKDARIRTTLRKESSESKQMHRRFSAYGGNIHDQFESEDFVVAPVSDSPEDTISHGPDVDILEDIDALNKHSSVLSPVKEEMTDIREDIEQKNESEDSDDSESDSNINFEQPSGETTTPKPKYSDADTFESDHSSRDNADVPLEETPDTSPRRPPSNKNSLVSIVEPLDIGIKSPGSARSSAIDEIVTEFALHSKESSASESSFDSKETVTDSEKQTDADSKSLKTHYPSLKKKSVSSSESVSPCDSKAAFSMDEHITLISDEMEEEFGTMKGNRSFNPLQKFREKVSAKETLEPDVTQEIKEDPTPRSSESDGSKTTSPEQKASSKYSQDSSNDSDD